MDEARAEAVPVEGRGPPQRQGDGKIHEASPHGGVVRCTPYLTASGTCPLSQLLLRDGVHLNAKGMTRYMEEVRRCTVHAVPNCVRQTRGDCTSGTIMRISDITKTIVRCTNFRMMDTV